MANVLQIVSDVNRSVVFDRCQMISQVTRSVIEENQRILLRRWQWVRAEGSCIAFGMDRETTAVLHELSQEELELAGDCASPLFGLAVDEIAMANLIKGDSYVVQQDPVSAHIIEENEELLFTRWAAARQDDIQAKMVFAIGPRVVHFLQNATLHDLRKVARSGHVCGRILVRHNYFWQAGKSTHLGLAQRSCLGLVAARQGR